MNKEELITRLRSDLDRGICVRGLESMRDASTSFIRECAANADEDLVGVFALRGAVVSLLHVIDDENSPDNDRFVRIENELWPLLRSCVDAFANAKSAGSSLLCPAALAAIIRALNARPLT